MSDNDPFLWLEDIDGPRALAWVRAENARSLALLERDPRYPVLLAEARAIITAADRIPYPSFLGDDLVNFWQDEAHVRGLWRRTTLDSFRAAEPRWETLLDIDALAAAEGRNWVFHGVVSLPPEYRRCLIALSDGGKDASELREFDLASRRFAANGFALPEAKQSAVWLDDDTLLVARDWGPGTLTASGYPFIVKKVGRGVPLADADQILPGTPRGCQRGGNGVPRPGRNASRRRNQSPNNLFRRRALPLTRRRPAAPPGAAPVEFCRFGPRPPRLLARPELGRPP